ncbi:unnamed protein product [Lupinus luteus]|uniref:F-box domain-containing protein n=1 Tax=Lupinus luteus TaxID=3873 RepID=A0AAV1WRB0_LUPLU
MDVRDSEETTFHGDILEAIFSHVPLVHLLAACHASKSWKRAVSSSLSHVNPIKPWLIILTQCPRAPHLITTHAYDPRSHVWLEIKPKPSMAIKHASAVRSSHSTLLYTLSSAEFAFSLDPLHLKWHHAPPPTVWRTDPIVACVGNHIVIAGGACDFEDDPLAVETYDIVKNAWVTCQSMPELLKGSTASTWLSVAVVGDTMYLTEKYSGMTYTFNPIANLWNGPFDLRPDQSVMFCVTGTLRKRLAVAGIVGEGENVKVVKIWVVKGELGSGMVMEELSEMPKEMVEKIMGGSEFGLGSVVVTWVGDFVYVWNSIKGEEVVACEVVNGGTCEWESVKNFAVNERTRMKRVVLSGADVCFENLRREVGIRMKVT